MRHIIPNRRRLFTTIGPLALGGRHRTVGLHQLGRQCGDTHSDMWEYRAQAHRASVG